MVYLIAWMIFGVLTAWMAKSKRRNPVTGFFIGFLFGPFGLIYMLVVRHMNSECTAIDRALQAKADAEGNTRGSKTYYIRADKAEWNAVRSAVLQVLEPYDTRIRQSDDSRFFAEVEQSGYVQMCPYHTEEAAYIFVRSLNAGAIGFGALAYAVTEEAPDAVRERGEDESRTIIDESASGKRTTLVLAGLAVAAALVFLFYDARADAVTCSADTVQQLVNDITQPMMKEQLIFETLAEEDVSAAVKYRLIKSMGTAAAIEGLEAAEKRAESLLRGAVFSMVGFRTVARDKELRKVECVAEVRYGALSKETAYNAQLTDDGKKIYVEVTGFLD